MATTNCSYIDSSNIYQELVCTASKNCCTSSQSNTCTTEPCSNSNSDSSNTISPTLFWSILGGLFGTGIILIFLMYIICKFRAPNSCLSEQQMSEAEMFEEECHEINTVSHHPAQHHPRFYFRRESFWKITRRKSTTKSTNPRTVCVKCEQKQEKQEKNNEQPNDEVEMKNKITIIKNVAQQKNAKHLNISPMPDVG